MSQIRNSGLFRILILLPILLVAVAPARAADDITGIWLSHDRDGHVEIRGCGTSLCGHVVSILDASIPANPRDIYNEKIELRSRPICDLPVLGDLKNQGDAWGGGWVYDPRAGKTYNAEVRLRDAKTLAVRGYLGIKLMGETKIWTRASNDFRRCLRPRG
jgi:uncharacterized protein (DUF2147 family)